MHQCIKIYLTTLLIGTSHTAFPFECHPKIDLSRDQYIIGYGSLIDEQSKKRTDETAEENIPVILKGYKRSWSVHGTFPGLNATFLSVTPEHAASFNGVIYKLKHPNHIEKYDSREKVYCRREISPNQLNSFSVTLPEKKQIWIYVSNHNKNEPPSADFPVVQSYIDIFIRGCLSIEEKYNIDHFAKQCILSTEHWPNGWINDRIFPRRPSIYEPYASKIDHLVKETLPEQFKQIRFE